MRWATTTIGALMLVGCDFGAGQAALRAELEASSTRMSELERELERLTAELAKERETRLRECAMRATPGDADPQRIAGLVDPPGVTGLAGDAVPVVPIDFSVIKCAADRCEVPRATFEAVAADPTQLMRHVRIVPHVKDGVSRGFKLFAIRAGSPLALLGLQNGDVITSIGEFAIAAADQALEAFARLKGRNEWKIAGDRRGEAFAVTVVITEN